MKKPMLLENDGLCNFTPVTEDIVPTVSDTYNTNGETVAEWQWQNLDTVPD